MRLPVLVVGLLMMTTRVFAGCEQLSVDTSRGVVRDTASGLTWSRCLLGQVGSGCLGKGASLSLVEAMNQARAIELGGVSNWRLPKIEEFAAICDRPGLRGRGFSRQRDVGRLERVG